MRLVRTLLVALLLPLGFVGGYFVGTRLSDNSVHLSSGQKQSAENAGKLQQKVIEELQQHYYKKVDVGKLSRAGVDGLLQSLQDPWTVYFTPAEMRLFTEQTEGKYSGIGAALEKKKDKLFIAAVFDRSPAKKAGLRAGDEIISVDGEVTEGLSLEASIAKIKGPAGTKVTLRIRTVGGQPRTLTITRQEISIPLTDSKLLTAGAEKVGYVELSQFADGAGRQVGAALRRMVQKGAGWIIFDLRNNGGGLLTEAVDVASDFIRSGTIVSTQGLHSPKEILKADGDVVTRLPVVLLVNGYTASASEIVSGALQDYHRAHLIGTRTFGKGLVQNVYSLPGGAALKITTAVYLTPAGRDINTRGIAPDLVVKDDEKTTADEVLQAALRYIAAQP